MAEQPFATVVSVIDALELLPVAGRR